jgi:hypothetical protein
MPARGRRRVLHRHHHLRSACSASPCRVLGRSACEHGKSPCFQASERTSFPVLYRRWPASFHVRLRYLDPLFITTYYSCCQTPEEEKMHDCLPQGTCSSLLHTSSIGSLKQPSHLINVDTIQDHRCYCQVRRGVSNYT